MPAFTSITINDGQSTPVAHVFAPLNKVGNKASYEDRSNGNALGYIRIDHSIVRSSSKEQANVAKVKMEMPTIATVDGAIQKVRYGTTEITFNFSASATDQERKDQYAYAANWLANSTVKASILGLEPFYA